MSSGRFDKICKLGDGEFLQAHISKCSVADWRKSANWGGFLQAHISKCPVADLRKICKPGGDFCMQVSVNVQWQI